MSHWQCDIMCFAMGILKTILHKIRSLRGSCTPRNKNIYLSRPQAKVEIHPKSSCRVIIAGRDNIVIIRSCMVSGEICIYGSHNMLIIGEGCRILPHNGIYIGTPDFPTENAKLEIGKNCGLMGSSTIRLMEDGSAIYIGDDCLFSTGVKIWCTDSHSILSESGDLLNQGKTISIGKHCWIGMDVKICKNTVIPPDCVVGWGSVVSRKFAESNCVLAGIPAKVVRRGVKWSEQRPNIFMGKIVEDDWIEELRRATPKESLILRCARKAKKLLSNCGKRSAYALRPK